MFQQPHRPSRSVLRSFFGFVGVAVVLAVWAPSAPAATTFGSDVSQAADGPGQQQQVTYVQDILPGVQITSPVSGVVVRWRLKSAGGTPPRVRLRVIRPVIGGYMAVSTDLTAQIVPTTAALNTYSTRLPIQAGDKLGVETLSMAPGSNLYVFRNAAGSDNDKYPNEAGFPDGTTKSNVAGLPVEILVNADVEPDCDNDGLGDETQDGDLSSCAKPPTCKGQRLTISGTGGADQIVGTPGADVIDARGAADKVRGRGGNEVICGGAGKDILKGGPGDDKLYGQGAKDKLVGGGATDKCVGGKASDKAKGCETVKSI
jgi:hypothetical protein